MRTVCISFLGKVAGCHAVGGGLETLGYTRLPVPIRGVAIPYVRSAKPHHIPIENGCLPEHAEVISWSNCVAGQFVVDLRDVQLWFLLHHAGQLGFRTA